MTKVGKIIYEEKLAYGKEVEAKIKAEDEEKRLITLHDAIKNAMDSFQVTLAEAMDALKISKADRAELMKRF